MMKNSSRHGFTLVELLIGIVMMVIVIGGIAFAVSSGFDLYTKADSNSVVISGVRFTADSLNRSVAPMLNSTNEIEILSEDSFTTASKTTSNDIHYIYLSTTGATKGSVIHRHKLLNGNMVNDVLEGSENIDRIGFSIPVSSVDQTDNYILKIGIRGVNSSDIKAKLDLNIGKALYNNKPQKTSPSAPIVGGDYIGNVLRIKAGFYLEALNLYNYDSNENINETTKQKGIKIEAAYDLINQTITLEPMLDTSTIEWFITESLSPDLPVMADNLNPQSANRTRGLWQLVSGDTNIKIKGNILYTTSADKFKVATREWDSNWKNVIRCRVTPEIKSQSGRSTVTGSPVWSKYVIVSSETPPSNMIPGTNIGGGTGILATDDWEQSIIDNHNIGFTIGQKFFYEDKYYVAVETKSNIYYNGNNSPNQNVWWTTQSGGGLVQFTGVSKSWDEAIDGDKFYRGDIVFYDGTYYVCKIGAPGDVFTVRKDANHNNHPESGEGGWAWYKLSS